MRLYSASVVFYACTVKYHSNDPGSLSKHWDESGGGSFNWYSYLEGRLPYILPILGEGHLYGRGRLYGTLRYVSMNYWGFFTLLTHADIHHDIYLLPRSDCHHIPPPSGPPGQQTCSPRGTHIPPSSPGWLWWCWELPGAGLVQVDIC